MTIASFLMAHGSALILPLAIIEGPIVTTIAGFLSAQDYFAWYWALCLLICGDVIGDLLYYWLGCTAAAPLVRFGTRIGLRCVPSPELQRDLMQNATKMLLIGKWTHSIGFVVLTGSGMLRVPLGQFFLVNLLGTIPKTAVLFGLGYFAGRDYLVFERHAILIASLLSILGLGFILLIIHRASVSRVRS
ncbi:MAG TPA: VTT domain-containing protein [Acetobacteraceae bacterium]|nr:VTT domain-containing protein [Acetobacteraceae bacterium]